MKLNIYNNIEIFIIAIIREFSINITIYSIKRITILAYLNIVVFIDNSGSRPEILELPGALRALRATPS